MTDDDKNRQDANEESVNEEQFEDIRDEGEMDQEMAAPGERELEGGEVLSAEETLSEEDDNAAVDSEELRREVEGGEGVELEDPPERNYAIGSNMVRNIFVGSGIGAVVVIVVILTLTSAVDQARYTPADTTQYQRTLTDATQELSGYAQNENGRATIPIEQAIALTAERGLGEINTELGVPTPQAGSQGQATQSQPAQSQPAQSQAEGQADQQQAQADQAQPQQQAETQQAAQDTGQGEQQAEQAQGEGQAEQAQGGAVPEVFTAGESVYTANCLSCHQANGQGIAGAFPTLVDHVPALYNADRSYLINLQLYGLQGQIQVQGQSYNGVMPQWSQLSDQQLADVLNYVSTNWDNNQDLQGFQPYTPEEIAAERDKGLSSSDVYNQRPSVQ